MNLFLRMFLALMAARRAKAISIDDAAEIRQRIWFNDTDGQGRLQKGRYSSYSDLGIFTFLTRTGILDISRRNGWLPIVVGREIDLIAPDHVGRSVTLVTRLTGWDDRYTFFEQEVLIDGERAAIIRTIGRVTSSKEKVPLVRRVLKELGLPESAERPPPAMLSGALARMKAARRT